MDQDGNPNKNMLIQPSLPDLNPKTNLKDIYLQIPINIYILYVFRYIAFEDHVDLQEEFL